MGCVGEGLQCDETMVSICAKDAGGPYDYEVNSVPPTIYLNNVIIAAILVFVNLIAVKALARHVYI